jgi:large subunit ribosomal protein L32
MAVPKKKISKSRRNMRRSHDKLNMIVSGHCNNCQAYKTNHNMCEECGFYKGVLVKAPKIKAKKSQE